MRKQLLTGALAVGTAIYGIAIQANPAEAIAITRACNSAIVNNVDANPSGAPFNLGCELGTVNNDFVPGGISTTPNSNHQVNKDSMFGFQDWLFAGKDGDTPFLNISPTFPANLINGSYDLNSIVQSTWTDVMLVFKGGGGNITPDEYVGYLLAKDSLGGWTGTFTTPFSNSKNGNQAEISHLSLYYRENPEVIPTPAAVLPGLVGMGAAVFRKKKHTGEASQEA